MIEDQVGDGSKFGLDILYSSDGSQLLGTGGALKKALPILEETFFVIYGDSYLDCDYSAVYKQYKRSKRLALMTIYRNEGLYDNSNIVLKNQEIVCYSKKYHTSEMQYIDYGLGILQRRLLNNLEPNKSYDLADIYADLIKKRELACYISRKRFYEIGSHEGLNELSNVLHHSFRIV
jgi:NDP-sugar pyrophosphorylase family protein